MGIYLTPVATTCRFWRMEDYPRDMVDVEHLDAYLNEFTFRFNRRTSRSRGKLFFRLLEQAVAVNPAPYKSFVKCYARLASPRPQGIAATGVR